MRQTAPPPERPRRACPSADRNSEIPQMHRLAYEPPAIDVTLGSRIPVRVTAWLGTDIVTAVATLGMQPSAILHLRTRPPWDKRRVVWSLVAGYGPRTSPSDSVSEWVYLTKLHLKSAARERGDERGTWTEADAADVATTYGELAKVAGEIARAAAARCDEPARRVALRFSPVTRAWLYQRIVDDRTGRVSQLALAAPGTLVFAAGAAARNGMAPVADEILRDAVRGLRLRTLLARAVDVWAEHTDPRFPPSQEALRRQARIVLRTGAWVPPGITVERPPTHFAEADIPEAVFRNARWHRVMRAHFRLFDDSERHGREADAAVTGFLSRRGLEAFPRARQIHRLRRKVVELLDYTRATGRRPGRATDPRRLMADVRAWHREFAADARPRAPAENGCDARSVPPETPLPAPSLPAWSSPDGDILVPIATAGRLALESLEMEHCVATYLRPVLAGESVIVAGTVAGKRITIEVDVRSAAAPVLVQASRARNAQPTREQWKILRTWMARAGMRFRQTTEEFEDIPF